jgi:hypothetical protein
MPNHKEHQDTSGACAGLAAGISAFAAGGRAFQIVCETAGGYMAGRLTGTLPDVFEPANCWNHRGVCHAIIPVGSSLTWYSGYVPTLQQFCREQAKTAELNMASAATTLEAIGQFCTAVLWYMAAGTVIGAPVGYGVHLLQDAGTPQGPRLLTRGF